MGSPFHADFVSGYINGYSTHALSPGSTTEPTRDMFLAQDDTVDIKPGDFHASPPDSTDVDSDDSQLGTFNFIVISVF